MKKEIEVVAAVIEKDNKIFCAQRQDKGEVALKWEFPGGKVEVGESNEEALIREIYEELNSEIKVESFITSINYEYKTFILKMKVFKCSLIKGNLELKEHVDSKWVDKNKLYELDWAPADLPIIEILNINY